MAINYYSGNIFVNAYGEKANLGVHKINVNLALDKYPGILKITSFPMLVLVMPTCTAGLIPLYNDRVFRLRKPDP